jgi:hypothetical protein
MGKRQLFAFALGTALLVAALGSPVPASSPSPSPSATSAATLAPIDDGSVPAPAASASPGQPKIIGHIYTSAYCTNFVEHFNTAARIVISNDQHLDSVDVNLREIENDWNKRDGAIRVYEDRVELIAIVDKMLKSIPVSQAAVNELLAQAKATSDPVRKAALLESASQLQKTIDRQRAVTYDLTNVIHVLLDKHKTEDMAETNIRNTLPYGYQAVHITALDDPVPEPGTDTLMQPAPSPSPSPGATPAPPAAGSVEDIMQWTRQRSIIGTAESKAAVAADRVVRICNQEKDALPSPSPSPSPSP